MNEKAGTSRRNEVGPVDFEWSQPARATGPGEIKQKQRLAETGTTGTSGTNISDEDFIERAALIEYGANVPRDWAEVFSLLDLSAPPDGFDQKRWRQIIDDGGRFLDQWGQRAAQLGWIPLDIFGVHPTTPSCRYDQMGLVPLIGGGEVVSITERGASIRTPGGSRLTYTRRPSTEGGVCLWELDRFLDQPRCAAGSALFQFRLKPKVFRYG